MHFVHLLHYFDLFKKKRLEFLTFSLYYNYCYRYLKCLFLDTCVWVSVIKNSVL